LRETAIVDTKPDESGMFGHGIDIADGASLDAETCEVEGNTGVGVIAYDSGTSVTLRETTIVDTQPDGKGEGGYGIEVRNGASLDTEACEVRGNSTVGVIAYDSGTSVTLRETSIEDTLPMEDGSFGLGIDVYGGACLDAEACEVARNAILGVRVADTGTSVSLRETTVEDTQPDENGEGGYGIDVYGGASLDAVACEVGGNTNAGVVALDSGTTVTLQDTRIASTMRGAVQTVGVGVAVQESATVEATGIEVSSNEGLGFYAIVDDTYVACLGCRIQDNQFAGAVVVAGASLQLTESAVEGTAEQENLGGGVGIYSSPWDWDSPALIITDTTIQDNAIAGVWLSGEGTYSLSGNTIHGGEGWSRESLTKCGDAIFAEEGVTAWDGSSGLLLEGNEILDGLGAGLFLDNASATLSGNSYAENAVDLVSQGAGCATPPEGYEGEALGSAELCPTYDYATCGDEFRLYLALEGLESGHGATILRPGLPGPGELYLPALSIALPHTLEPPPLTPSAPRREPLKFRPPPLRPEHPPPIPLVAPSTR